MLWVLNFSDGAHSLLDIAERSHLDPNKLQLAGEMLLDQDLWRNKILPLKAHEEEASIAGDEHTRRDAAAPPLFRPRACAVLSLWPGANLLRHANTHQHDRF